MTQWSSLDNGAKIKLEIDDIYEFFKINKELLRQNQIEKEENEKLRQVEKEEIEKLRLKLRQYEKEEKKNTEIEIEKK